MAGRLDLADFIGELHQALGAGEKLGAEVGAQAVADHGDIQLAGDEPQLLDHIGAQELRFIGQGAVLAAKGSMLQLGIRADQEVSGAFQAGARADQGLAESGVEGRF